MCLRVNPNIWLFSLGLPEINNTNVASIHPNNKKKCLNLILVIFLQKCINLFFSYCLYFFNKLFFIDFFYFNIILQLFTFFVAKLINIFNGSIDPITFIHL